ARKALECIKKLDPPRSIPCALLPSRVEWRSDKNGATQRVEEVVNPFTKSFVVHNPTIQREKPGEEVDPFLKELNADESYSLLKCKKPWTLVVKDFQGPATVVQSQSTSSKFLDSLLGNHPGVLLDAGAKQAHEIARVLREAMHFEAYVLHTRYGSIVTV